MPPSPPGRSFPVNHERLTTDTFLASVEQHQSLGSTNDRAKVLAREEGIDLPALILAHQQTAGRGRGVNRWWTGPGSLAFTLLLNTDSWGISRDQISLTALVAGIALVEAVVPRITVSCGTPQECQEAPPVGLHWPNDVYIGNRKLAGILVEIPTKNRLVVGVGVNTNCRLADAPALLRDRVATLLDQTGEVQDHTSLLVDWLNGWETWTARLSPHGEAIGRRANELCLQRGQSLRLRLGTELHEGRCLGIASDGSLRLETATGLRAFRSGTIE